MNAKKVLSRLTLVTLIFVIGTATTNFMCEYSQNNTPQVAWSFQIEDIVNPTITSGAITVQAATVEKKVDKKTKKKKKKRFDYNKKELYMLSHVINGEAGNSTWKDMLYVGSVVLNRVKSKRFPNTMKKVIFAHNQYACTWDENYNKKPTKRAIKAAKYLLRHGSQLPTKVVWQSGVRQTSKVYGNKKIGGHYYCY